MHHRSLTVLFIERKDIPTNKTELKMDVAKMLADLRQEREAIEEAIITLERLARGRGKRRGRPPAWLSEVKKRGRPAGSKNKPARRKLLRPINRKCGTAPHIHLSWIEKIRRAPDDEGSYLVLHVLHHGARIPTGFHCLDCFSIADQEPVGFKVHLAGIQLL